MRGLDGAALTELLPVEKGAVAFVSDEGGGLCRISAVEVAEDLKGGAGT